MHNWNDLLSTHSRIGQSPVTDSENSNPLQALNDTWASSRLPLSHPQHSLISQHQITGDIHHHISQLREEMQLENAKHAHAATPQHRWSPPGRHYTHKHCILITLTASQLHTQKDVNEFMFSRRTKLWLLGRVRLSHAGCKIVNVIKNNAENTGALNSPFFVNSTQPKFLIKIT